MMFTLTDWLMLWAAATILLAGINWLYERRLRPILADIFGWEAWTEEDYIPPVYFLGAFCVFRYVLSRFFRLCGRSRWALGSKT